MLSRGASPRGHRYLERTEGKLKAQARIEGAQRIPIVQLQEAMQGDGE